MTSQPNSVDDSITVEERLAEIKDERERALACAFLSLAISLALILSNFPGNRKPIDEAKKAVAEHTKLLADIQQALQANQQVLAENQQALVNIRKSATTP